MSAHLSLKGLTDYLGLYIGALKPNVGLNWDCGLYSYLIVWHEESWEILRAAWTIIKQTVQSNTYGIVCFRRTQKKTLKCVSTLFRSFRAFP